LVIGAGPIGLGTIQFASIAGGKVIAMDTNQSRLDFCKANLDIAETINPLEENATEKLAAITNGEMATVVIDATGNLKAINNAFQYIAHSGRFVLIGLQKENISFSHPEFHKRETTLMSSRNAYRADFETVVDAMVKKQVNPLTYITHRVQFGEVQDNFKSWLDPKEGVIKAMVEMA
jgi:threonine dehydrogenase-like Zn-dependent dehydrogenase